MTKTRAERADALEAWADTVDPAELRSTDTGALRHIAELAQQRDDVDADLAQTVQAARAAHCSWSEIGAMFGFSKQAAQRKYGHQGLRLTQRSNDLHPALWGRALRTPTPSGIVMAWLAHASAPPSTKVC